MKKLFTFLFVLVLMVAMVFVGFLFGPQISEFLFDTGTEAKWLSERFSETLKEKNELVVYEAEITGQETITQDAFLFGTVQKVEMPYQFNINFAVDLSKAKVSCEGNEISIRVAGPRASYYKLTVDDDAMKKSDFFYPLTPERYADIKNELEIRLYEEGQSNQQYLKDAWDVTVRNLKALLESVAQNNAIHTNYTVKVIRDDTLLSAPANTQAPVEEVVTIDAE
ncbi:MAG: DUF4230 domain-containing protein [Clostridiales bacterium]|nr:DUF4230 domain-containing protein [Clostridiales bacterium]